MRINHYYYYYYYLMIPMIPNMYHIQLTLSNPEQRLVTMSVSLHTQTGWPNLTSQILNTWVHFIDIWYTSLTSVHYNLEHELAIVTESFSNLSYTTSFANIWIRCDATRQAVPDIVYLPCALNWAKLVWTGPSIAAKSV